ncbi:MAG: WbqC family protein [Bacteroidota bacterium]
MKALLHPAYFPNIATFAVLANHDTVWEIHDNFQKQTYRNRSYICTDQGLHMLTIPIKHVGGKDGRQKYSDVTVDNSYPWQKQHWRTLQTAYRTSPFFEFFEDDLVFLFEKKVNFLLDFNLLTIETVGNCLGINPTKEKTTHFELSPTAYIDRRRLVIAKQKTSVKLKAYTQVFGDRHGFIENASILDLLFNEGPNTLDYLKNISMDH